MKGLDNLFSGMQRHMKGGIGTGVNFAGSIYQLTLGTKSLILGRDTLRLTYSDNDKNAIISFTPCKISIGSFEREIELHLNCYTSNMTETYNRLYVDGGELFQFSTVHDFDFGMLPELYTKYLELLKVMKDSSSVKGEKLHIDEAIANLSDTVELYNKEA